MGNIQPPNHKPPPMPWAVVILMVRRSSPATSRRRVQSLTATLSMVISSSLDGATLPAMCQGRGDPGARRGSPLAWPVGMVIRRILVPVDFSSRSLPALDHAFGLAQLSGAAIDLLHVLPPPGAARVMVDAYLGRPLPQVSPLSVADAREKLHDVAATCDRQGIVPELHVEVGDAAATIVRMASETAA